MPRLMRTHVELTLLVEEQHFAQVHRIHEEQSCYSAQEGASDLIRIVLIGCAWMVCLK